MKIALIDTGHANLRSVERALLTARDLLDVQTASRTAVLRTHQESDIRQADKIVVPGQGGFGDCVGGLRKNGIEETLTERVRAGVPYFGICLGLQALFESSTEAEGVSGLGLIPGACQRLLPEPGIKIPHMGWNSLSLQSGGHPVLDAAGGDGTWMYFVHSFHGVPVDSSVIKATVQHGSQTVTAAIAKDNIIATQFHPEKSQRAGLKLLEAFLRL